MVRGVGNSASPRLQMAFLNVLSVLFWESGDGDEERRFITEPGVSQQHQAQTPMATAPHQSETSPEDGSGGGGGGGGVMAAMGSPLRPGAARALASRPLRGLRQQLATNGRLIAELVKTVDRAVSVAGRAKVRKGSIDLCEGTEGTKPNAHKKRKRKEKKSHRILFL